MSVGVKARNSDSVCASERECKPNGVKERNTDFVCVWREREMYGERNNGRAKEINTIYVHSYVLLWEY